MTAHTVCVYGFTRGSISRNRELWYVVYDDAGRSVTGAPGESRSAVEIRYCETVGVPAKWYRFKFVFSPGEFAEMRASHKSFAKACAEEVVRSADAAGFSPHGSESDPAHLRAARRPRRKPIRDSLPSVVRSVIAKGRA